MIKSIKTAIWQIIRAEGIEVTNQNLDWLLERAWKSVKMPMDADGWIAVEDALPDPAKYDWVLGNVMFNEDGTYGVPCVVEHRADGKWHRLDGWDTAALYETVTHWMPLPNYPKTKE